MDKNLRKELIERVSTLFLGAFGLVAALAWNDAVQSLVKVIFPGDQSDILAKFGYAVVITIVVVIVSWRLLKITEKYTKDGENK